MTLTAEDQTYIELGYFDFLDHLRADGCTNMLGAAPYLVEAFELSRKDARHILGRWMTTFSIRNPKGESQP